MYSFNKCLLVNNFQMLHIAKTYVNKDKTNNQEYHKF